MDVEENGIVSLWADGWRHWLARYSWGGFLFFFGFFGYRYFNWRYAAVFTLNCWRSLMIVLSFLTDAETVAPNLRWCWSGLGLSIGHLCTASWALTWCSRPQSSGEQAAAQRRYLVCRAFTMFSSKSKWGGLSAWLEKGSSIWVAGLWLHISSWTFRACLLHSAVMVAGSVLWTLLSASTLGGTNLVGSHRRRRLNDVAPSDLSFQSPDLAPPSRHQRLVVYCSHRLLLPIVIA